MQNLASLLTAYWKEGCSLQNVKVHIIHIFLSTKSPSFSSNDFKRSMIQVSTLQDETYQRSFVNSNPNLFELSHLRFLKIEQMLTVSLVIKSRQSVLHVSVFYNKIIYSADRRNSLCGFRIKVQSLIMNQVKSLNVYLLLLIVSITTFRSMKKLVANTTELFHRKLTQAVPLRIIFPIKLWCKQIYI